MLGEDCIKGADGCAGGTGSDIMGECNVEGAAVYCGMLALWVQAGTLWALWVKAALDKETPKSSRELRELVVLAGMSMVG